MDEIASLELATKAKRVAGGFEFKQDKLHEECRKLHKSCRQMFDSESMKVEDVTKLWDDGRMDIRFEPLKGESDLFSEGLVFDAKKKEIEQLLENSDRIHHLVDEQDKRELDKLRIEIGDEAYDKSCSFKELREKQSSDLSFKLGPHLVSVSKLDKQNEILDEEKECTFVTRVHSFIVERLQLLMKDENLGWMKLSIPPELDNLVMSVFRKKPLRVTAKLAVPITGTSKRRDTQGELIDIEVIEQQPLPF